MLALLFFFPAFQFESVFGNEGKKKKTKRELEIFFYWTQYSTIVTGSSIYGYIKRKLTWVLARKTEKNTIC